MNDKECIFKNSKPLDPFPSGDCFEEYKKIGRLAYLQYKCEEKQYIADFNAENHCNPHNPCSEYPEFYEGLNKIRKQYGLDEIHPIGCPNKEKSYEKNK